jgi:hypothetical protein
MMMMPKMTHKLNSNDDNDDDDDDDDKNDSQVQTK